MRLKPIWWGIVVFAILFNIWLFTNFCSAQDKFDQAEIIFDIDYVDIDTVKIFGSENKGQVIAVWMKSGSVLTKTLLKSNKEYEANGSDVYSNSDDNYFYQTVVLPNSTVGLIDKAKDVIAKPKWTRITPNGHFNEELILFNIFMKLSRLGSKGYEFVDIGIKMIEADLEHGVKLKDLSFESMRLKNFAEGDGDLIVLVDTFLKNIKED